MRSTLAWQIVNLGFRKGRANKWEIGEDEVIEYNLKEDSDDNRSTAAPAIQFLIRLIRRPFKIW